MRKIFQYILMVVAVVATASCSNEMDEALQPAHNGTLQFVVSDFPAFGENPETRAIGTEDPGKTAWEKDDEIIITLASQKFGTQSTALTYDGTSWSTAASLSYLETETPTVSVIYAPCYEVTNAGVMQLKEGMQLGMSEYLVGDCIGIVDGVMTITFGGATHDYSRLRIAGLAKQTLTVTTTDFIPAGMNESGEYTYTLTTDDKGNAYLYGIFAEKATVSVKKGVVTLKDYTFTAEKYPGGTYSRWSYALDVIPVIDGTLGGKTTLTKEEVNALVEQLKSWVDNGITTITVTGSEPALYNFYDVYTPAVSVAIFRLTEDSESSVGSGDPDSPYCGKIDLILQDVTEILEMEFNNSFALNSITLPKVTKLADQAFSMTPYLRTITFGSVLTEVNDTDIAMFDRVGEEVDGCDLILNCGQMNESSVPTPDLTTNTWTFKWVNSFKSITLTHTGECDGCKANQ